MSDQRVDLMRGGSGFIAALDQSGGSTPKALERYGVSNDAYSNDDEMFDVVHEMRVRIMKDEAFNRPRILGAILFEGTMQRDVEDVPTSRYLWQQKGILPFLKVDKGLADESDGVQLMKPFADDLDARLQEARDLEMFGTKMRSVIHSSNSAGIQAIVEQQFDYARQILAAGLVPIVEPEIDIHAADKAECESKLRTELRQGLDTLEPGDAIVFKLTLPETSGFYHEFSDHPSVLRVAALSGGYSQEESNARLTSNSNMIASFSRALTEHLRVQQSNEEFTNALDSAIGGIAAASAT
ncbi:MAG: fructose bisphosphate aldolase [Gammaproteobacteria bacterium]|nr:fructose bisphosphate aldolase [Gammaproteobacteria bacterium]